MTHIKYLILLLLIPFSLSAQPYVKEGTDHNDGELGILPLAVRNDANTALAADGKKIAITTDADGNVWTKAAQSGTWTVTTTPSIPAAEVQFGVTATIAHGSITGAYTLAVATVAGTKVVILDNQTNGDVWTSLDAGASDTFHLKAGDRLTVNFADSNLFLNDAIHVKDGISASTSGNLFIYTYR